MRTCLRCNEVMIDGYLLQIANLTAVGTIQLSKNKGLLNSDTLGKVKVVICPKCGEISIFFDQLDKIK